MCFKIFPRMEIAGEKLHSMEDWKLKKDELVREYKEVDTKISALMKSLPASACTPRRHTQCPMVGDNLGYFLKLREHALTLGKDFASPAILLTQNWKGKNNWSQPHMSTANPAYPVFFPFLKHPIPPLLPPTSVADLNCASKMVASLLACMHVYQQLW